MSSNTPTRKPLKQQPRNTTRKSKEEREAIARQEEERQRQRTEAARAEAAEEATRQRMQYGPPYNASDRNLAVRRREFHGSGTRGGFMGAQDLQQRRKAIAEGLAERRNEAHRSTQHGSRPSRSGERTSRSGTKTMQRKSSDGDIEMVGDPKVKSEPEDEPDMIDLDDEFGGPRKNIEHINLVSSDESEGEEVQSDVHGVGGEGLPFRQAPRKGLDMVPIRLNRREHVDRVAGINTEASSTAAVELRRTAPDGKFVDTPVDSLTGGVRGKGRSNEVELLSEGQRWRGVYEDEEDIGKITSSRIKKGSKSPTLKRSAGAAAEETDIPVDDIGALEPVGTETTVAPEEEKAVQDKPKPKQRKAADHRGGKAHTNLTEEHKREEELYRQELKILRGELGRQTLDLTLTQDPTSSTSLEMEPRDDKADNVYLFQLPPVVPNLFDPVNRVKPELEQTQETTPSAQITLSTGNVNKQDIIKIENDGTDAHKRGNEGDIRGPKLTSGKAGKLQVHKSGRVTLSWGGTCMEVKLGTSVSFLQTAVLVDDKHEGGPLVTSIGNLRGRFVVCPDWNEILT